MESRNDVVPFPGSPTLLKNHNIHGVHIEARGRFSALGSSEFLPASSARIFLLMSGVHSDIQNVHHLSIPCVPIDEARLGDRRDGQWQDVGREIGWMRAMGLTGRLMADDVSPVPFQELFFDVVLPADAFVIRGRLEKAVVQLPPEIQAPSLDHYFISGMSLRTVDTFRNRPGGGTRVAV